MDSLKNLIASYFTLIILTLLFVIPQKGFAQSNSQLEEFKQTAEKALGENNLNEAAKYYNKIAYLYWDDQKLNESAEYFKKSLELNEKIGSKNSMAGINSNLGMIYFDLKNYSTSISYFEKGYDLRKQMNDKSGQASDLINLGMVYQSMKNHNSAITKLETALALAKEINNVQLTKNCYSLLAESYEKLGNTTKSYEYYNYYVALEKQTQKEELKKSKEEINKLAERTRETEQEKLLKEKELEEQNKKLKSTEEVLVETEKGNQIRDEKINLLNKEKEIKELSLKEKEEELENNRLKIYLILGTAIFMGMFGFISYRSFKQKAKAHQLLEKQSAEIKEKSLELEKAFTEIKEQNHKITSSINYAQRIQEAMLPTSQGIKSHIGESFILFKPRDIVSGDFYWFKSLQYKTGSSEDFILAACDCTGHGIPGAFMSMIGYNLLNEISERGVINTNIILEELHVGVRNALNQHSNDNRDGMDMALCKFTKKDQTVEYAGAKNPLYFIKNNELIEIKADVNPIGGIQKEDKRTFNKHLIKIDSPTTFYMFSDGYADQFGGEQGRKFMYSKFRELLLQIHSKPMEEQKQILDTTIENWKGGKHKQIDDILIIGFKVG
jgi:serine phosphatase RsbU (regulator of sigma subunit)